MRNVSSKDSQFAANVPPDRRTAGRFLSAPLGKLYLLLAALSVILLLVTSVAKKSDLREQARLELAGVLQLIKKSAADRY